MHPYPPYEIQPEYGSYYSNFRTIPGLRQHLADVPGHKVKFCEQQDKAITPVADTSCAHHRCRDCGMGHLSRQFRDRHYQRFRHVRDHKEHSKVSVRRRRASRTSAPSAPRTSAGFSYVRGVVAATFLVRFGVVIGAPSNQSICSADLAVQLSIKGYAEI